MRWNIYTLINGRIIYSMCQVASSATLSGTPEADKLRHFPSVGFPLQKCPCALLGCLPPGLWGKHQAAFHSYWLETLGWHENPSQWPNAVQIQVRVPVRVLRGPQTVKLQSRLLKGQHHWNDRFFMKTAQEIMCAQIEHLEKLVLLYLYFIYFYFEDTSHIS